MGARTALVTLGLTVTMLFAAAPAQAQIGGTVSCGQVISGTVTLANDLICADTDGLIVGADNTAIDLNGHKITCLASGYQGSCQGLLASDAPDQGDPENGIQIDGRRNVRVFSSKPGGTIDGFDNGVLIGSREDACQTLCPSSNVTVERLIITGPPAQRPYNPRPASHGVEVYYTSCADGNSIDIGSGPGSGNDISNHNQGIAVGPGDCVDVLGNRVHDNNSDGNTPGTPAPPPTNGILLHNSSNSVVRGNEVFDNGDPGDSTRDSPFGAGGDAGITLRLGSRLNLIADNFVNDNLGDGISVRSSSDANKLENNTMLGNGKTFPAGTFFDASGRDAGPANEWNANNICMTQNAEVPEGTCGLTEARVSDAAVTEGKKGESTSATFTVSLSERSLRQVSVDFQTADGSATAPDDYGSRSGTLTFEVGEQTKTVTVQVKGDNSPEPDERFFVRLSNPTAASIGDGEGIGTVKNDDGRRPR